MQMLQFGRRGCETVAVKNIALLIKDKIYQHFVRWRWRIFSIGSNVCKCIWPDLKLFIYCKSFQLSFDWSFAVWRSTGKVGVQSWRNHWAAFCKFYIQRITPSRKFNNFRLAPLLSLFWCGQLFNSWRKKNRKIWSRQNSFPEPSMRPFNWIILEVKYRRK